MVVPSISDDGLDLKTHQCGETVGSAQVADKHRRRLGWQFQGERGKQLRTPQSLNVGAAQVANIAEECGGNFKHNLLGFP